MKQDYLEKDPVKNTTAIKIPETDSVEIYTVEEMQSLLAKAPEALIPFLAIGAFAGVRVSELKELDWKNINLLKKQITIIASIAKTGKKRVIPIYPVLRRFLKPYAQASGKIKPRGFDAMEEKLHSDMREDGRWIDNGMRHSFASYAVAKEQNTAKVSRWMGHTKPETIHKHYLDWLEKKDGKSYFSITSKRKNIVEFKEAVV